MNTKIIEWDKKYINEMINIWNEIVDEGIAFPQEELLTADSGIGFFNSQSFVGICLDENEKVLALYILHPNNIGRCGHICNASFAVKSTERGQHIGEQIVKHCMIKGKELGFKILQFNAVVSTNIHARHLYERIGFTQLGVIPKGFKLKNGQYEDICPYYINL